MGVETTKGRRSRGVRSRILLTAISWLFLHTVHLFTIPHGRISPSRPGWKDSCGPQVTRWHPGRGGVALRASPQDSDAEDCREEVEGFCRTGSKPYCWMLGLKQTTSPKSPPFC
ncbi:unnamed protein product [Effrenium voratum]|nr:unnamed protein product [Effrenium voratum]